VKAALPPAAGTFLAANPSRAVAQTARLNNRDEPIRDGSTVTTPRSVKRTLLPFAASAQFPPRSRRPSVGRAGNGRLLQPRNRQVNCAKTDLDRCWRELEANVVAMSLSTRNLMGLRGKKGAGNGQRALCCAAAPIVRRRYSCPASEGTGEVGWVAVAEVERQLLKASTSFQ
jgi:hypothetical protein